MLKKIIPAGLTAILLFLLPGLAQAQQRELEKAWKNFSECPKQRLEIIYQGTDDPNYNTPELVLQYPAGAWYNEHHLDKKAQIYYYLDGFDGMSKEVVRRGEKIYLREGVAYQAVRNPDTYAEMFISSLAQLKDLQPLKTAYAIKKIGQGNNHHIFTFRSQAQDKLLGKKHYGQILISYQNKVWLKNGKIVQVIYFQVYRNGAKREYAAGKIKFFYPSELASKIKADLKSFP